MESLLDPNSLVIYGLSANPHAYSHKVLTCLRNSGFPKPMYGVNPKRAGETILGVPVLPSAADAPHQIDCAFLAVRADQVLAAVQDCGRAGVRSAVVLASGMSELGDHGRNLEAAIKAAADATCMRLLGPNTFGALRSASKLTLSTHGWMPSGELGLVTQSGNVAIEAFVAARARGVGFSACVGVGNQLDITFADVVSYLAGDEHTKAVGLYIEGLPTGSAARFWAGVDLCVVAGKPVVAIKGGRTRESAEVATSHTGALVGDDRVWDAHFRAHGVTRVTSAQELVDALHCAVAIPPRARRVAILADGGGSSVLAADAVAAAGLTLAQLQDGTRARLTALAPKAAPRGSQCNPLALDTAGGMNDDPTILADCVEVLAADTEVDLVMFAGVIGLYADRRDLERRLGEQLVDIAGRGTSIAIATPFARQQLEVTDLLRAGGIPLFESITELAQAVGKTRAGFGAAASAPHSPRARVPRHQPAPTTAAALRRLPLPEICDLLRGSDIDAPRICLGESIDEIDRALDTFSYPVCLKLADPLIGHKSELGGVVTGIAGKDAALQVAQRLLGIAAGAPVAVMESFRSGCEMMLGGYWDPTFGPTIILGRGGIWVELEDDAVIMEAPLSPEAVRSRLPALRMYDMLRGGRGQQPLAVHELATLTARASRMLGDNPGLAFDFNPVIVYPDGVAIADMRAQLTCSP